MVKSMIALLCVVAVPVAWSAEAPPVGQTSLRLDTLEQDNENPVRSARKSIAEIENEIGVQGSRIVTSQATAIMLRSVLGANSPLAANARALTVVQEVRQRELREERESLIQEIQTESEENL